MPVPTSVVAQFPEYHLKEPPGGKIPPDNVSVTVAPAHTVPDGEAEMPEGATAQIVTVFFGVFLLNPLGEPQSFRAYTSYVDPDVNPFIVTGKEVTGTSVPDAPGVAPRPGVKPAGPYSIYNVLP